MNPAAPFPLTRELASWARTLSHDDLPPAVRGESIRAFLNWFGCVLGGSAEDVTRRAAVAVAHPGGRASLIGHGQRAAPADAAFVNCVASSALAYDDTHLATVTHPTGPVAAALMTRAESSPCTGAEFLTALAVGIEIQCRLSNLLLLPPARPNLSLYITGITGPIGAAAALARLRGLDEDGVRWAMGHAATQGAGFRATHGSMAGLIVPGYAARSAVLATDLAGAGIDCASDVLESERGFVGVFTSGADLPGAAAGLGSAFELMANAYKPYPAGIVLHAAIDACIALLPQLGAGDEIAGINLTVPPLTVALADRRHPSTPYEAQISLQHWAAHVFCRRSAGIEALQQPQINAPDIAALRDRVRVVTDDSLARDAAAAEVVFADGRRVSSSIAHANGSIANPMSDDQLDAKFLGQARRVLAAAEAERLLAVLRGIAGAGDIGEALAPWLRVRPSGAAA